MFEKSLQEMVEISHYAGVRTDYTQGGGGNTSVKLDDKLMAIKASGYRLKDITDTDGYVTVKYQDVCQYYRTVNTAENKDFELESVAIAKNAVDKLPGMKDLRPSVEVGFHSILSKYVIHTHTVYANLLTCTTAGERTEKVIFMGADYGFISLPYIKPGFTLTLVMDKMLHDYEKANGRVAEVIFMQNHGLVVHSNDLSRVKYLQEDVNRRIMVHFGLDDNDFPAVILEKVGENQFESKSPIVKSFMKTNKLCLETLDELPFYPDQLVYLNNTLRVSPEKMKVEGGKVTYFTHEKEAMTLEETLAAYLYVRMRLAEFTLPYSTMSAEDVEFITNWEVEKFRRNAAK